MPSRKRNAEAILVSSLLLVVLLSWGVTRLVLSLVFDFYCADHLSRAATANTVETARAELNVAITHLEGNGITHGYTSIFVPFPSDDVGFFYTNLVSAREELDKVVPTTTQLERTNLLMKLRETLMTKKDGKDKIAVPEGISVAPYNRLFFFWMCCGIVLAIPFVWFTYNEIG